MLNCLVTVDCIFMYTQNPGDKEVITAEDSSWQVLPFLLLQVKLTRVGELEFK